MVFNANWFLYLLFYREKFLYFFVLTCYSEFLLVVSFLMMDPLCSDLIQVTSVVLFPTRFVFGFNFF